MPGTALIGNLAVNLTMETAAFQRGATIAEKRAEGMRTKFAGVAKSMAGIGAALAGGVIVAGLTSAASSAFEMASALSEAAEKVGVTVEALQELRFAAGQAGVTNEQLDAALIRLSKSMGDLQLGEKQATDAFAAIGLAADDLKGKSPDQALRIIADALNKIPDPATRVAIGQDLMGRGFAKLLPLINGGSKALNEYAEESRKAGQVSNEDAQKLDELADSWEKLKVRVGVATANIIAGTATFVTNVNNGLKSLSESARNFDAAVANMARNVGTWIGNMVVSVKNWLVDKLNAVWETVTAKIEAVKNAFFNMYDAVVGHSYVPDMVEGIARSMGELQKVMVDPALSATEKVGTAFQSLAGLIGDLFGSKAGSIVGALGQFAMALAPLFKGAAPTQGFVGPPAMANGGSGVFGGRSGVDRNILSLNGSPIARVSKGEHFRVSPANDGPDRLMVVPSPYFDVVVDERARNVAAPMAGQAAVLGVTGSEARQQRMGRRRIP